MNSLVEIFAARKDVEFHRQMHAAVITGMYPFKTGRIALSLEENWDTRGRYLRVDVEAVPEYPFKIELDAILILAYPDEVYDEIYEPLFNHFRYRPTIEVDDNVQLGEN